LASLQAVVGGALALTVALVSASAGAHDPSAYGGLFRSRDLGQTWLNADVGLFLSAALAVAIDPRDPNHLLLGTDRGLMRSRTGGRSWAPEAPTEIIGAVFALAFSPDGAHAICAAPSGVFYLDSDRWMPARVPEGATPGRGVAFGSVPGRVYLLGSQGLFRSDDGGRSYRRLATLAGEAEIAALAAAIEPREVIYAVAAGALMTSADGGETWRRSSTGLGATAVDAIAPDPRVPGRVWAGGGDRIHVSDDGGSSWRAVGEALPDPGTGVRGIAAEPSATTLIVTTARGMYRSVDGGATWTLTEGNLPVHLEAGPLARDPSDARTLYAVYSLVPYAQAWRTALEGTNLLARADPVSLAGGLAFVLLLMICGALLVRWLVRQRSTATLSRRSAL
jgi:photosystem II stability/assembly factor-like uncharacterized protein